MKQPKGSSVNEETPEEQQLQRDLDHLSSLLVKVCVHRICINGGELWLKDLGFSVEMFELQYLEC